MASKYFVIVILWQKEVAHLISDIPHYKGIIAYFLYRTEDQIK